MKKQALAVLAVIPALLFAGTASAATTTATAPTLHPLGVNFTPLATKVPTAAPSIGIEAVLPSSYVITNIPAVGDQGQQGSCVAWSTAYYQKSFGHGQTTLYTTSNEYSPSFVYNSLNGGVDGGLYPSDAYNLLVSSGDTSLANMPYNQLDYKTQPTAAQKSDAALHKNISSTNVFLGAGKGTATAQTAVKNALFGTSTDHKLVGLALPVYPEFDNATATDTYVITAPTKGERSRGGHMITIVGYDDTKAYSGGTGAFKIVNQWGTGWGNKGYSWISYDFFARIAQEAWYMNTGN